MLTSRIGTFEGLRIADLFAGTGALGLEALSRGAAHATFVEMERTAIGALTANIKTLGAGPQTTILARSADTPGAAAAPHDLLFLDPPYGQGLGEKALAHIAANGWLAPGATIVFEESADAEVEIPPGFTLEDRREYGAAAVHFLSFGEGS